MTSTFFLIFASLIYFNRNNENKLRFVLICMSLYSMGQLMPEGWIYNGYAFAANSFLCALCGFCLWGLDREDDDITGMYKPIMTLLFLCCCGQLSLLVLWTSANELEKHKLLVFNYYFINSLTAVELIALAGNTDGLSRLLIQLRGYLYRLSHSG